MSEKADIKIELEIPPTAPEKNRWDVVYAVRDAVDAVRVELEETLEIGSLSLHISRICHERRDTPEEAAGG